MENTVVGVAPQNLVSDAAGVSLSRSEHDFLDALVSLALNAVDTSYARSDEDIELREPPSDPDTSAQDIADAPLPDIDDDPFGVVVTAEYIPKARARAPREKVEKEWSKALKRLGRKAGLSLGDVEYLKAWVVDRDRMFLASAQDTEGKRSLQNPAVRRIINAASQAGLCNGTTATKDEIAEFYTRRMRCEVLPDSVRDNAADKLSRLMGYNPKDAGGGSTNVQINFVNPYGKTEEVVDASCDS